MKKAIQFLLLLPIILVSSCAKIYYSPTATTKVINHKVIAIAPPKVSIAAQKKVDPQAIIEQQKAESANFQKEMHNWLLKRKTQNRVFINILDVETTNAKLQKAGYFDGIPMTPAEICDVLDADAIMTSNYALTKPMSEGAAIVFGLLLGVWGSTNSATVSMEIHDKTSQELLWSFSHTASGSIGSSPATLVDYLMRRASKKMPYTVD